SCSTSAQPAKRLAPGDVVATVGSTPITLAEIDDKALQQPAGSFGEVKLVQALYEARRGALDEIIGDILLDQEAKARRLERAPIELIEFSDFQCPFCLQANPTVNQLLNAYGDRIRLVYRHYPLPNHPNARPAAEAAECASEQDKFWPFHDRLFANPAKLTDSDLKQAAA